jgi:oligopeptidase B
MRKLICFVTVAILLLSSSSARAQLDAGAAKPPMVKKVPKTTTIHGETLVDNYFWLREKTNSEVIAYLEAENAYTAAVLKPTEALQETLYKEFLGRIKQTDLSVPYKLGDYWYYTRTEKGKQYPIHCRKRGSLEDKEAITLDLNELAKGQKFLSLAHFKVSDDGNLLAYSIDLTGFREYTLYVKDLRTCELLPDRIAKVNSPEWAADNKTLFYVAEDAAKRPYRLHRHVLGSKDDPVIYEEKDELYRLFAHRSRDLKYMLATSRSSTTTEERYLPSAQPTGEWRVILPRENEHEYSVDHRDGQFYIRTNKDAKNFRLVTAPVDKPQPENWKELLPHRKEVLLESVALFENYGVVSERAGGLPRLRVFDWGSAKDHLIDFPEPVYSVFLDANPEFKTTTLRFRYFSLVTPDSVYDYDMNYRKRKLLKQTEVLGGYEPKDYVSERILATAKDGTPIPISLVYKKGVKRDGNNPLLLYGYGAYGATLPVIFSPIRLSLLDRGGIYAMAHIRGGKEMGQIWHDQGKMMNKRNTFTDFITAADHLVAEKYTSRDRLGIQGGSAGGLLIGAALNFRPDLCRAAVLQVPFVDVINTMLDESLPLTVQEFLEWGNPKIKSEYDYMKSYCPYTNLAAKDYPSMLVMTSLNDSQVMYWEPAKYVAKLRTLRTDKQPLVLRINMAAGHGGASGRYDALKEQAVIFAFLFNELGMVKP